MILVIAFPICFKACGRGSDKEEEASTAIKPRKPIAGHKISDVDFGICVCSLVATAGGCDEIARWLKGVRVGRDVGEGDGVIVFVDVRVIVAVGASGMMIFPVSPPVFPNLSQASTTTRYLPGGARVLSRKRR